MLENDSTTIYVNSCLAVLTAVGGLHALDASQVSRRHRFVDETMAVSMPVGDSEGIGPLGAAPDHAAAVARALGGTEPTPLGLRRAFAGAFERASRHVAINRRLRSPG